MLLALELEKMNV